MKWVTLIYCQVFQSCVSEPKDFCCFSCILIFLKIAFPPVEAVCSFPCWRVLKPFYV